MFSPKRRRLVVVRFICSLAFVLGLALLDCATTDAQRKPRGRPPAKPSASPAQPKATPAKSDYPNDGLSGEWNLSRKVLAEIAEFKMKLRLDGERVSGTVESRDAVKPIVRGSWKSGRLELAYGDADDPAEMTGYFRKDELWGRIVLPEKEKIALDRLPGVWHAKRTSPLPAKPVNTSSGTTANSQIRKIGIIYATVVARFRGTEQLVAEKLRKSLEEKTSESPEKVTVVMLKNPEEAAAAATDVVFTLDYREQIGVVSRSAMQGNLSNISCKFTRTDQNPLVTTWDKLDLRDGCEIVEWVLEYSTVGIGGPMADLGLYGACYKSFESLIPVLQVQPPAPKSAAN